jgi:hypothetical protein
MKLKKIITISAIVAIFATNASAQLEAFTGDNGKLGFKNESNKVVISPKYDNSNDGFNEGLSCVELDGKFGFIDTVGQTIIPLKYDYCRKFSDGLALVKLGEKYGFIDKSGQVAIPIIYNYAYTFFEGLADARMNKKLGYINKDGRIVIPFVYDETGCFGASAFGSGYAKVKLNNKWGIIDKTGKVIVPLKYDSFIAGSDIDLIKAKLNGKWGVVDISGKVIIEPKYDHLIFSNGGGILTYVQRNGKHGILDSYDGSTIMPIKYSSDNDAYNAYEAKESEKRAKRDAERAKQDAENEKYRDISRKNACKNLYVGKVVKFKGGILRLEHSAIILGIGDTMMTIKSTDSGYIQEAPCDGVY